MRLPSKGNNPIVIEEYDADPISDEQCDINPGEGRVLSLNLNLATCKIAGDLSFDSDVLQSIEHTGAWTGSGSRLVLKIQLTLRGSMSGVCMIHLAAAAAAGQKVTPITITAEALDDEADLSRRQG